jgi:HlyD family secretion protein
VVLKAGGFLKARDKVQPVMAALENAAADKLAASLTAKDDGREVR